MKLVRTVKKDHFPASGCVLTIGNFDAVHLGHQKIINRLVARAQELGVPAVLMTFAPNPDEYFRGAEAAPRLSSISARYLALQGLGLDTLVVLPFNRELAQTTAGDFIEQYLIEGLHVRHLIVGDDFRFGAGRQGNYQMLCDYGARHGFTVDRMDTIEDGGDRISSTRVRRALGNGEFGEVARLIGRNFSMTGRVAHGDKRGRQWGFPTLNLPQRRKPPLRGVFAVSVILQDKRKLAGVANLGNRPTVDGLKTLLEVHLFEFSGDLYGQRICVEFIGKVRDEQRFDSFDELKAQIMKDCETARGILKACEGEIDSG